MNIVLMSGMGIVGFLLIFMFFKLGEGEKKHYLLQLLMLGFILGIFVLIGKASLDSNDYSYCSWNMKNYTSVGGNITDMNYSFECPNNPPNTAGTFYKTTLWIMRVTFIYLFIYYFYELMSYFGLIKRREKE
jgi:hypothetical protein